MRAPGLVVSRENGGYTSLDMEELGFSMDGKGLTRRHALNLMVGNTQISTSGAESGFELLRAGMRSATPRPNHTNTTVTAEGLS